MKRKIIPAVQWIEANIRVEGDRLIRLKKHQKKILARALAVGSNGKLRYQTIVYSCPKKSGKSTLNAAVVLWTAYEAAPGTEIKVLANDLEQAAGRVFRIAKAMVKREPALMSRVEGMTQREIRLVDGTTITAVASDASGEAGSNHSLASQDELWGFVSENAVRHHEEHTPVPTLPISFRFITTYSGYVGESVLLEGIYQRGKKGKRLWSLLPVWENGPLFMYWDHKGRMPWQTKEYYEAQRQELRPLQYLRLHENRWVSSENALFDMGKWKLCEHSGHKPPMPDKNIRLFCGVDASVKKDRSAVVSVYYHEGRLMLGPKRWWQPSKANPMDLEQTLEAYLLELADSYTIQVCLYDPFQFHRSAMTLRQQGIHMVEFPQSVPNLTLMGSTLYDLVEYRNLTLYKCKELRAEAAVSIAKEKDRGLQISKEKSGDKIDQVVALAMAALEATRYGDPGPGASKVYVVSNADCGQEYGNFGSAAGDYFWRDRPSEWGSGGGGSGGGDWP
jgi:phage terminase large subunit-like protein